MFGFVRSHCVISSVVGALSLTVLAFFGYLGALQVTDNFHVVIPGDLYRSAQLSDSELETYVKKYGIKTVINLRGVNEGSGWYQQEVNVSNKLGIEHLDLGLSSRKMVTNEQTRELVQLMRTAPKPILIHCRSGSDRTGFAIALYTSRIAGWNKEEAGDQLSLAYGHLSVPYISAAYAMDKSWQLASVDQL